MNPTEKAPKNRNFGRLRRRYFLLTLACFLLGMIFGAGVLTLGFVLGIGGVTAFVSPAGLALLVLFFASGGALAALFVLLYRMTADVTDTLCELTAAARRLAAGDFDVSVAVRGNDDLAELAVAFNQTAQGLAVLRKEQNAFTATIVHDLRTPMTTVAGFVDGILTGAVPKEKHAHYLSIVSEEVKRLARLISATLDVSRILAGERQFSAASFDICEMARLALISFEQAIEKKHLEVFFHADTDRMTAYADRDAIYQVLYNICDNAVKFSKDGGELRLEIRKTEGGKKLSVTVRNEGNGIPKDELPHVFTRFYRADKRLNGDRTGVGLGMFISKAIMDAHGESLTAESEYGEYCAFTFTLSCTENAE